MKPGETTFIKGTGASEGHLEELLGEGRMTRQGSKKFCGPSERPRVDFRPRKQEGKRSAKEKFHNNMKSIIGITRRKMTQRTRKAA